MPELKVHPTVEARSLFFYGYIIVLAATCIMIVVYGIRASFGVFFKPMLAEFGWSRALNKMS